MKAFMLDIGGDILFLVVITLAFLSAALLVYATLVQGQSFMARYQSTFTDSASTNMADMFMFVDATRLFYMNIAAIVVLPLLVWAITRDAISALVLLGVLIILPGFFYRAMRKKRLKRFERQLPDGLLLVSGSMRAGASLNIALESLVKEQPPPLSQEFELFMREQRLGLDFEKSLDNMEKRMPLQDFTMVMSAMRISREVGGNLAETLESLADTLRRKQMMEGKIDSLTAQGKLQGIVMSLLPFLLAVLLYMLEPEAMSKLWTTKVGWGVLAGIIVWLGLGNFFIRKITRIDV
ncbi:MAG: type II secretion system F family protein [Gammaproteobacteria bacterium]|nr:type II secretion system F family protein [Gammaproteobacteria bacterium]